MSLSSSLSLASAGLDVSSRRAETVARNVANADRPGYARRSVEMAGPGVGMPGSGVAISREVDPRLVQLRREAEADQSGASVERDFQVRLEQVIGEPEDLDGLQAQFARLDSAFISAASDPTSAVRVSEIARAADSLARKFNDVDDIIQAQRQSADTQIGNAVDQINSDLTEVSRLNVDIRRLAAGGQDVAGLIDQRTLIVDRISREIPVRELPRDDGVIALVSDGGLLLLDGRPAALGFSARAPITPEMQPPIQLSGLTMNGRDVPVSGSANAVAGGRLSSLFELRDEIAPEATERLDSLAGTVMVRFEAVDGTRAATDPGLFTDWGSTYDPAGDPGLAGRLEVNALVAPDMPQNHWRLRDGLGATATMSISETSLLLEYGSAMSLSDSPITTSLPSRSSDLIGHASTLRSLISTDRVGSENVSAVAAARTSELQNLRDGGAVDLDSEMRNLIDIEQAYAANARIIQAVSQMMDRLTEL